MRSHDKKDKQHRPMSLIEKVRANSEFVINDLGKTASDLGDNFGYNRLLGTARQRMATRMLTARGEMAKLIAWYSR